MLLRKKRSGFTREYPKGQIFAKKDEISLVMLINKMQTREEIEEFRKLPVDKVEAILKDFPKHILDIIANVLLAFLLKENVSAAEAEELVGKVREKKMAELFENMEPMDIQAERRNTAEQRERAEKAEENTIKVLIESLQEFGHEKDAVITKIMEKLDLSEAMALEKVERYWKK